MENHWLTNANAVEDPQCDFHFEVESGFVTEPVNLAPLSGAMLVDPADFPSDAWFEPLEFFGAFAPDGTNWMTCWSYLEQLGFFGEANNGGGGTESVPGCTYDFACNYDPAATIDNGTCEVDSCDCPADLTQDGSVGMADLLDFLLDYGSDCGE